MVRWLQRCVSPSLAMICALTCTAESADAQPQIVRELVPLPNMQVERAGPLSHERLAQLLRAAPRPQLTLLPFLTNRRSYQDPSGLAPPDTARRSPWRPTADATLPNFVDLFAGRSQDTTSLQDVARASPQGEAAPQFEAQAATASTASCAPTTPIAEIAVLTRALRCDAALIYEHVYNNIEVLPILGSLKGPLGTLLDGKGTPIDVAELTTLLLREAGYDAVIAIGQRSHSNASLASWLESDSDDTSISNVLGQGKIAFQPIGSGLASVAWAWVKLTTSEGTYYIDPATKEYTRFSGLPANTSLVNLMGYDRDSFFSLASSAQANATTVNAGQINRDFIRSYLGAYAGNLASNLPTFAPGASTLGVIGGKIIAPLESSRPIRLPNMASSVRVTDYEGTSIPIQYRHVMTVSFSNGSLLTIGSSDAYGRRLSVFVDQSNQPVLRLDGNVVATGPTATCNGSASITINVAITRPGFDPTLPANGSRNIPLAACDAQFRKGRYVISNGWGPVGRGMIEKHRNLLQARIAQGEASDSEGVLGESLAVLGFTWLAENARIQAVVDQIGGLSTNYFHGVGIVGMKPIRAGVPEGPFLDMPINRLSGIQRINRPDSAGFTPVETAAFFTTSGISSILESGVIEQTQAPSGAIAASTIKLMDEAIRTGPILSISDAEGTTRKYDELINYSDSDKGLIERGISDGKRIIAPLNGSISLQNTDYRGAGWLRIQTSTNSLEAAALITGGLNGGYPATAVPVPQLSMNIQVTSPPSVQSPTVQAVGIPKGGESSVQHLIGDPINTATGAYIYSHDDLTVGADPTPYGLGFQRTYDSAQRYVNGPLGLGWTHNFAVSARRDSDGFEGMAESSPISGAPTIAAIRVLLDVLQHPANTRVPLDRVVVAAVIQRWLMDQLTNNVVTVVQPGSTERFTKLPDGRYVPQPGSASTLTGADGSYVFRTKDQNTLTFNGANKLSTLQYANGPVLTFSYDGSGRLEYVDNQMYRRLTLTYNGDYLSEVYDYTGRKFTYTVDGVGDLVSVRDAMNQTTRYSYGIKGLLFEIFYPSFPSSPFVSNLYDDLGRMQFQRDASGLWSSLFFAGARSELQDSSGASQTLYLTPQGKPRVEIDGTGQATSYEYDGQNRVTKRTLPEQNSITYAYDARSNVTQETHTPKPNSGFGTRTRQFTYHPVFSKVASSTDFTGNVTNYSYDGSGNLVEVLQPAVDRPGSGSVRPRTTYSYDGRGRRVSETDAEGRVTRYDYDPNYAQLIAVVVDQGPGRANLTTNYGYDSAGNRTLATDGNGQQTTFDYDAMRRIVTARPPSGSGDSPTTYEYDPDGRQTSLRRATSFGTQETKTSYHPTGEVSSIVDPSGQITYYTYHRDYRRKDVFDAESRTTYTALDANGRVLGVARSGTIVDLRGYTPNGLLAQRGDGNGTSKITYTYDGFDRLIETCHHEQRPDVCRPNAEGTSEKFAYTVDDDLSYRRSRRGQEVRWTYDALHRPVTKAGSPSVAYTYDLVGRQLSATTPAVAGDPSTGRWETYYDGAGRQGLEISPDGRQVGYYWDNAGNRVFLCLKNAGPAGFACFRSTYDALNRHVSTSTNNQSGAPEVPVWTDSFDALGRFRTRALANASTTSYGYAGTSNDVTSILRTFPSGQNDLYSYTYNRVHQVSAHSTNSHVPLAHPAAPGTVSLGEPDRVNRLSSLGYDWADVMADGTRSYTYDGEGAGRIVTASYPGGSALYRYDPFGRRYSKTVNGVTTVYLHDSEGNEVAEFDGGSGALLRYRLYSRQTAAPVVSLYGDGASVEAYPAVDPLGSVVSTSDGQGNYLGATAYLPYGQSQTGGPPPGSGFGFAGYRYDAETGLYYVRNRYYDPRLGRWLQPDPIGQDGGVNLYAYVGNDPLNLTDPSGLCPQCIGAVLGLGVDLAVNFGDYSKAFAAGNYGEVAGRGSIAAGAGALGGFAGGKAVSIAIQRFNTLGSGTAGAGLELAAGAVGNGFGNGVQQGAQIIAGYRDNFSAGDVGVAAAAGALGSNIAAGIRGAGQAIAVEASAMARTAADAINQFNGAAFGAGFDLLRKGQDPSPAPRPEFRPRISLDGGRS